MWAKRSSKLCTKLVAWLSNYDELTMLVATRSYHVYTEYHTHRHTLLAAKTYMHVCSWVCVRASALLLINAVAATFVANISN